MKKRVMILSGFMGVLFLFLSVFAAEVAVQSYMLSNYNKVFTNLENGEFQEEYEIYHFEDTDFVYSTNDNSDLENGVVETEDSVKVYTDGEAQIIDKQDYDINSTEDIYSNYLIYIYTSYIYLPIILTFLMTSLVKYSVLIALGFVLYKVLDHLFNRGDYVNYNLSNKVMFKLTFVTSLFPIFVYSIIDLYGYEKISYIFYVVSYLIIAGYIYKNKKRLKEK